MKKRPITRELFVVVFWSPATGKIGYRGAVEAVTSENKVGKFDILPEHTNFITLVFNKMVLHRTEKKGVEFSFKRGVLEVSNNLVRVFLGI